MKPRIDYARIFRAAARMEDTGKARQLLQVVATSAKEKDMGHLTDKTHAEHFKQRKEDIDHLHRELKNELRMVQSEVSRKLRRHFTHADIKSASGFEFLFDPETLAADLADILAGTLPDMLVDAGQDVWEDFLPPPEEAKAFITERENLMTNVAQETFDSVKNELQEGLNKGESYRELAKRLSSKFDEINEGRAQTVASTEVASAYGYARNEAMKQSGAKFKLWVGSGRPPGTLHGMRPAHAAAHYEGQTVAIEEPFRVGGASLMFPTDSSLGAGPELTINCHCIALPAEPIKAGYDPNEPRVPAGMSKGGQWTDAGAGDPKQISADANTSDTGKPITNAPAYRFGTEHSDMVFYSKERDYSEEYATEKGGSASDVHSTSVSLHNPLVIDAPDNKFSSPEYEHPIIKRAKTSGYDGVVFRNGIDIFYVRFVN